MNKQIKRLVGVALITSLLLVSPAFADHGSDSVTSGSSGSGDTTTQTTTETTSSDDSTTVSTDTSTTTLQDRIEKHKTDLKLALTKAEEKKLELACKPAQTVVKGVENKVNGALSSRYKAYDNLNSHLTDIIAKLKAAGLDTTELTSEQTILATKIATFKTAAAAYKQALDDTKALDCATDPTGFKASLENARNLRTTLSKDLTDIRNYVTSTIKPTLVTLRSQLEAKSETEGSNE